MNVTVLYVGSSLLAPLKEAEQEINRTYKLELRIAAHNFGAPLDDDGWLEVDNDLAQAEVVFVIHVMDGENAARLLVALERYKTQHAAVIVINCMPDLMRRTRMGKLDVAKLSGAFGPDRKTRGSKSERALRLFGTASSWIGRQARAREKHGAPDSATTANGGNAHKNGHGQYLKLVDRLPGILRFVPGVGAMRDVKNYLNIFCYFLQPTPANIRASGISKLVLNEESKVQSPKSKVLGIDSRCCLNNWSAANAAAGCQQDNEALRRADSRHRNRRLECHPRAFNADGQSRGSQQVLHRSSVSSFKSQVSSCSRN